MAKTCHQNKIIAIHCSSRVARNKEGCHKKNLINLYLNCYQSWLNLPVVQHHFGYITKLTKKIGLDAIEGH
jgi:hypothetical protein